MLPLTLTFLYLHYIHVWVNTGKEVWGSYFIARIPRVSVFYLYMFVKKIRLTVRNYNGALLVQEKGSKDYYLNINEKNFLLTKVLSHFASSVKKGIIRNEKFLPLPPAEENFFN